jgi:hypothetical protein
MGSVDKILERFTLRKAPENLLGYGAREWHVQSGESPDARLRVRSLTFRIVRPIASLKLVGLSMQE